MGGRGKREIAEISKRIKAPQGKKIKIKDNPIKRKIGKKERWEEVDSGEKGREGGTLGISFLFALCGKAVARARHQSLPRFQSDLQQSQQN
jgi:hypothetical protein